MSNPSESRSPDAEWITISVVKARCSRCRRTFESWQVHKDKLPIHYSLGNYCQGSGKEVEA